MGGGDTVKDDVVEEESSRSSPCSCCLSGSDDLGFKDDGVVSDDNSSNHAANLRRIRKAYQETLQSDHDLLLRSSKRKLRQARNKILSYTPGSWSDGKVSDYDVQNTTSIIVVGPKGSGKSSLVNRITRVIEDDEFSPARAQEIFGTQSKRGSYFVEEYKIPRGGSASFCLYDTRGLSHTSSSDNTSMIKQWMTRGVRHGEPVICASDSSELKDRLIRDRDGGATGYETRKVNSVIFVVDAVEIMKSINNKTSYMHMVSTAFDCPFLSFKDDKPAVVMTHGDLLSREDRVVARVLLGELLGIPPDKQIFDISESRDTATALTICNLLCYSLEHADKNLVFLAKRNFTIPKVVGGLDLRSIVLFVVFMALASVWVVKHTSVISQNVAHEAQDKLRTFPSPRLNNLTHKVSPKRYIGPQQIIGGPKLARVPKPGSESVTEGEPSTDLHIARRLWFDEGKVAEAKPSLDWRRRTTRRLWYVE